MAEHKVSSKVFAAGDLAPPPFLLFWLAGWTLGGLYVLATVLWQLAGREAVSVTASALIHRIEIFGIGIDRSYDTSHIRHLRATEALASPYWYQRTMLPPLSGSGAGQVAFDYGGRTIRFGTSLDRAEASLLVASLLPHLPRPL
ncbi:hypothetical protein GTP23_00445 [Pseudoduganella sp. FT93W]|uniref:Uncharacterized protein n=1 Tax=Duganella fentianensis TaxID=2692177 RepID=A0A845HRF1_9BURK|nr:hypothetical protein [Duganella fentianensis]MYN43533.1 hypothetical protein [Duganella fentianensis]